MRNETTSFLTIDGEEVPLSRCVRYLRTSGHFGTFLGEILRQHVLDRELARRPDLEPSDTMVDIALADFCEQRQLTGEEMMKEWLVAHDEDATSLVERIRYEYRIEKLKHAVTTPELEQYFADRRPFLDRVSLSRLIFDSEQEARAARDRIAAGSTFDAGAGGELAQLQPIERAALPASLLRELESALVGDVLGPISFPECWALYRFDEGVPASLEDASVKKALRDELFERWIGEQLESLSVDLHVAVD